VRIAAALTVVILLGFGGYTAWNAIAGDGGSSGSAAPAGGEYEQSVTETIFLGAVVLRQGLDAHVISELNPFLASSNDAIAMVATRRNALGELAKTATGPEADVIASTQESMTMLQMAMAQWRDAVVNLRLAAVADAHEAVDDAIAVLEADLDIWRSLPSRS
jgi:predicted negative regulator of RcsB-dependent stress response